MTHDNSPKAVAQVVIPAQEFAFQASAAPLFAGFLMQEYLSFRCLPSERKGRVWFSEIWPEDDAQRVRLVEFARMIGVGYLEINRERIKVPDPRDPDLSGL